MVTNNQSLEVMVMSFFDAARDATTVITALAAIWGGVFAFLNWRRTKTADLPCSWLEGVMPDENGLVRTNLSVDNRGAADVLVTRIVLGVGCFAGEAVMSPGGEWLPGPKTGQREKPLSLHVPSRKTRGTEVTFYLDDHESPVFVRLDERDGSFHAVLTATQK